MTDDTRDLRQRYEDALLAVHRHRSAEQASDSPEGHCAAFADAVLPVRDDELRAARTQASAERARGDELHDLYVEVTREAEACANAAYDADRKLAAVRELVNADADRYESAYDLMGQIRAALDGDGHE